MDVADAEPTQVGNERAASARVKPPWSCSR